MNSIVKTFNFDTKEGLETVQKKNLPFLFLEVHQSPKAFIDLLKTNGQHRFELSNREGKKVENKSMHFQRLFHKR